MVNDTLKQNKEKLKWYKRKGIKKVGIVFLHPHEDVVYLPKEIISLSDAEKRVKKISDEGMSFMAVD
jgi:hypothetical protein